MRQSPTIGKQRTDNFVAEIVKEINSAKLLPSPPHTIDKGNPFQQFSVSLAGSDGNTLLQDLQTDGYQLVYKRDDSHPQGRLLVEIGSKFVDFWPGCRIRGHFENVRIYLSPNSINLGFAQLVVVKREDVDYIEPSSAIPGLSFQPIDLLGVSKTPTFSTGAVDDTQPTGAPGSLTGAFHIDGIQRVRVALDFGAAAASTTTLIPWVYEPNSKLWFEQGFEAQTIPVPSDGGNARYRLINLNLSGNGWMFLETHGSVPNAPNIIIQAIG